MDSKIDKTRTIVVEGTTETLKAHVDKILADGSRIVSVQTVAPARLGEPPSTFKIVFADGD